MLVMSLRKKEYTGTNASRYQYAYGANGQVARVIDNNLNREAYTDFDLADRPCQTELHDTLTGQRFYRTVLKYDKLNNLSEFSEQVGGNTHRSAFVYDNDNRITSITYDNSAHKVTYTYDELGRIKNRVAECGATAGKNTVTYGYVPSTAYTTKGTGTTNLIQSISQSGINFTYEYDTRGNIISETRNGLATTYVYDALGQLTRVNDPHENATWVYTYDCGGNLLTKQRHTYSTGALGTLQETIQYTYGDSNWKDKLTKYNGVTITYDAIGNPLSDGTWTYTWENGRQLKKMVSSGKTVEFKYDHNGMRVQKVATVNGVTETTNYVYHGKLLTHMTVGSDTLHFYYDAQKRPAKVKYGDDVYTYVHNLQGDIVGILDSTGVLVVEYKYDAWGKPLSVSGTLEDTLGKNNPFRYRGYVYDDEMLLYYLMSRYYDVNKLRFMNADSIIGDGKFAAANMFVYCNDSPICYVDRNGHRAEWAIKARNKAIFFARMAEHRNNLRTLERKNAGRYETTWYEKALTSVKEVIGAVKSELSRWSLQFGFGAGIYLAYGSKETNGIFEFSGGQKKDFLTVKFENGEFDIGQEFILMTLEGTLLGVTVGNQTTYFHSALSDVCVCEDNWNPNPDLSCPAWQVENGATGSVGVGGSIYFILGGHFSFSTLIAQPAY